jgi:hypothetical protein
MKSVAYDGGWQRIASDVYHIKGKCYLMLADCCSKYQELIYLHNAKKYYFIEEFKRIFSTLESHIK